MKLETNFPWHYLRGNIHAGFFFLGVFLAFFLCCEAGKIAAASNPFQNFRRFYYALNPATDFYPTVSQMLAIAKEPIRAGKTLVIIGGSSIGMGLGQGDQLWSDKLEKMLGPNFAVRNFAMPNNISPFSGPYFVFLSLSRTTDKIYYVTFSRPGIQANIEDPFLGYSYYWDARCKNLLPSMPGLERDIEFRRAEKPTSDEAFLQAILDSQFYFRDLWTTVAYRSFFTAWTKDTGSNFMRARQSFPDYERANRIPVPQRFGRFNNNIELERIRWPIRSFFKPDGRMPDGISDALQKTILHDQIHSAMPDRLRSQILQVDVRCCPYFFHLLSPADQREYDLVSQLNRELWLKAGCRQLIVGEDYQDNDYDDAFHLSASGGLKLARSVADQLQAAENARKNPH